MGGFLVRRVGQLGVTLLLVSLVVFFLLRLIPGDPAVLLAGEDATPEVVADLRARFGLDRPVVGQYLSWAGAVVRGDLGVSIRSQQPVLEEVLERMPATLLLGGVAVGIAMGLGVVLGVVAAWRVGGWPDLVVLGGVLLGVSAPSFWVGLLLVLVFAVQLGWLPVSGDEGWASLVLPVATLVPLSVAVFARLTRSAMLDALGEDYVRTAVAKGVRPVLVLVRHALRNALLPVVTMAGLEFARVLGGVIAVETIFAWPGAGRALVDAIVSRDFPMVQGIVLAFALVFTVSNGVVDVVNGAIDPRLRR